MCICLIFFSFYSSVNSSNYLLNQEIKAFYLFILWKMFKWTFKFNEFK